MVAAMQQGKPRDRWDKAFTGREDNNWKVQ
jgi:hypothetical protein